MKRTIPNGARILNSVAVQCQQPSLPVSPRAAAVVAIATELEL